MKKRFLSVLILICCMFVMCGCANMEYLRVVDDNGQIMDKFTLELDRKDIISKIGTTRYDELQKDIKLDLKNYTDNINNRRLELQREYGGQKDFLNGVGVAVSEWFALNATTDQIFVQVNYASIEYYKLINNISDDGSKEDNNEIVSNWFVSKYIIKATNTFSNLEELGGEDNYFDYYTGHYPEFSMDDVNLTQIYGTTDSRLKSNADYVEKIEGINYHLWEIDAKNGAYKTCELSYYYLTAVGTGWYIIALALSIALAVILIVVYVVKTVKAKKYKEKIIIPLDQIDRDDE